MKLLMLMINLTLSTCYVMHAWKKIHILLTFQCVVKGGNANNLSVVIIQSII
jgi:hypothetical protein